MMSRFELSILSVVCVATGCAEEGPRAAVEAVIGGMGRTDGRFISPRSVALRPDGSELCVVDKSGRIQRFSASAGEPAGGAWTFAGAWRLPAFEIGQPTGIRYGRDGNLLVADTHYQRILVFDPASGALVRSFGSAGSGPGEFTQVRDVVEAAEGAIFAADYAGPRDRIQKFDAGGRFLLEFGDRGDGPGEFRRPQALAVHVTVDGGARRETLLVADCCNHRLQRFTLEGEFIEAFGGLGTGPGEFRYPYGIAAEPRDGGDIFVAEWQNNRIQRFDARGRPLGSWGGPGRERGELATPWDVDVAPDGLVFVADFGNNRVQVFRWPAGALGRRAAPRPDAASIARRWTP